jgi:hypothetical protein
LYILLKSFTHTTQNQRLNIGDNDNRSTRTFPVLLAFLGCVHSCLPYARRHTGQPGIDHRRRLQFELASHVARIRSLTSSSVWPLSEGSEHQVAGVVQRAVKRSVRAAFNFKLHFILSSLYHVPSTCDPHNFPYITMCGRRSVLASQLVDRGSRWNWKQSQGQRFGWAWVRPPPFFLVCISLVLTDLLGLHRCTTAAMWRISK